MDLELTDDQVALRDELRRFLTDQVTPERRAAAAARPGAVDRELWTDLHELGVFTLTLPETDGGVGLGVAEAVVAFEELGRAAVPGPLVATFLAAGAGVAGAVVGAIEGAAPAVIEHLDALDALLVLDGDDLSVITGDDLPRPAALAHPFDPLTPVTRVDSLPAGVSLGAVGARRDVAGLLAAALQVGLGQAALDMGSGYALERHQFGRAIGSFQAVKHLLADAAVAVEVARAAVHAAAVAIDELAPDAHRAMWSARVVASRAAHAATAANVQVHGGMGYTWELEAHLFLKRAAVLDLTSTTVDEALEHLAGAVLG